MGLRLGYLLAVQNVAIRHNIKTNKTMIKLILKYTICKWFGHNRNNWWIGKYRPIHCSICNTNIGK